MPGQHQLRPERAPPGPASPGRTPSGRGSNPRSKVTGGDTICSRWSPEQSTRSGADQRQTCPGECPGVCTTSQLRPPTASRSPPVEQPVGPPIEGMTGIQSRRPSELSVSSRPVEAVVGEHQRAAVDGLVGVVVLGQVELGAASCIHSSPPLRRTTSPARPKWSMCACVTTSRSIRSSALPAARSAADSAPPVPSGPGSPPSDAGGDAAVDERVAVVAVQQVGAHGRHAVDAERQRQPVHAGRRPRDLDAVHRARRPGPAPARRSVPDLGHGAQLVGGRGRRSRRTPGRPGSARTACRLPTWIGQPLSWAAARNGVISCFITTSPTNVVGRDPVDVHRQRVVVVHAERGGVDDEVVALRVLRTGR